jgi:chromosome segregation ATPase
MAKDKEPPLDFKTALEHMRAFNARMVLPFQLIERVMATAAEAQQIQATAERLIRDHQATQAAQQQAIEDLEATITKLGQTRDFLKEEVATASASRDAAVASMTEVTDRYANRVTMLEAQLREKLAGLESSVAELTERVATLKTVEATLTERISRATQALIPA